MPSSLKQIWNKCNLVFGTIGIIGIVIGSVLLDSAQEITDKKKPHRAKNTPNKNIGLLILLISIAAVLYNIYYLYQKKCRNLIYKWTKGKYKHFI